MQVQGPSSFHSSVVGYVTVDVYHSHSDDSQLLLVGGCVHGH